MKLMKSMITKSLAANAAFVVLMAAGMFGCQTTGSGANVAGEKSMSECSRFINQRSNCSDTVGCFWDYDAGRCTTSSSHLAH